jgi:hypothetical protein
MRTQFLQKPQKNPPHCHVPLKIQDQNKKLKKTIEVDVLFKTYPMVTLSAYLIWQEGTFNLMFHSGTWKVR